MAIVTFDPYHGLRAFSQEVNRLFDAERPHNANTPADLEIRVDIEEAEEALTLRADLPGVDKKAIKVNVEKGFLTISGERKQEKSGEKGTFRRMERAFGNFSRTFKLPPSADDAQIAAKYQDGVLTITLPKKENSKPRKVEVSIH